MQQAIAEGKLVVPPIKTLLTISLGTLATVSAAHSFNLLNSAGLDAAHPVAAVSPAVPIGKMRAEVFKVQIQERVGAASAGGKRHFFSTSSPWNAAIDPAHVVYSLPTTLENRQFYDLKLGNTWVQRERLYFQTPKDAPPAKWTFNTLNKTAVGRGFSSHGSLAIPTPTNLLPTHGRDGWVVFTDPEELYYWEAWQARYDASSDSWSASYLVQGTLQGTGWGTAIGVGAGIRAAGSSLLGGLITSNELNGLQIDHAMAMELDPAQLKSGANPSEQFVFPAVSTDAGSVKSYKGSIPMGARFALPPNIDLDHAGLTPEGLAVAKAYQRYGGYVVDMAYRTTSIAMLGDWNDAQLSNLSRDAKWIRSHLVMITTER
ncbi:hypothetical protein [Bradyrhizobium sp. LTSP849]|uniref:hypothetical protein n=1 Tax=Bradyrhizobium sp. LTSP849 TaxID=1615890 RepID=UPI0012E08A75|nr:hypothetical protein [Bradyrhizobium sp. LTSP849]